MVHFTIYTHILRLKNSNAICTSLRKRLAVISSVSCFCVIVTTPPCCASKNPPSKLTYKSSDEVFVLHSAGIENVFRNSHTNVLQNIRDFFLTPQYTIRKISSETKF